MARLAIYTDAVYGVAQERLTAHSADHAFLTFAAAVGDQFDECVFVGRARPDAAYLPLGSSASFVPLPDYDSLANITAVLRAAPGTARGLWRAVGRADVVWAFGPHPFASLLIAIARLRRRPVVLGVRQESDAYFRSRAQGKRKLALARAADRSFRRAARGRRVTAVGEILAAAYRAAGADVLPMTVTLVHEADVVATVPARKWDDVELLAVGRLEPEKDPYLLIEVLAELERRSPGRYRLVWLGTGTLDQDVRERARDRGLEHLVDLRGHVLPGEVLSTLRTANIFVLTSKTEGVPQALIEAMASGTPIVATGVGGVRAALGDGRAGVVVDSRKPAAIADAVARVSDDEPLRQEVTQHALELARDQTLEAEALRVAGFVSDAASSAGSSSARSVELS